MLSRQKNLKIIFNKQPLPIAECGPSVSSSITGLNHSFCDSPHVEFQAMFWCWLLKKTTRFLLWWPSAMNFIEIWPAAAETQNLSLDQSVEWTLPRPSSGQNWKLCSPEKSITITIFPNDRFCSWTSVSRPTLSSLPLFFHFHRLVFYIKTTSQGFETSRLLPYILSAWRQKGNHGLKIDRTILGRLWWADAAASAAEGNN